MKNSIVDNFKNNYVVYSFLIYFFSLLYSILYYKKFSIQIIYYINLTDLIFYPYLILIENLNMILICSILLLGCLSILNYYEKRRKIYINDRLVKTINNRTFARHFRDISIWVLLANYLIYWRWENPLFLLVMWVILAINYYNYCIGLNINPIRRIVFLISTCLLLIISAKISSEETKIAGNEKKMSFKYNTKTYVLKHSSDIIIIGQSSNYLFLYNKKNGQSQIIEIDKIENVSIN